MVGSNFIDSSNVWSTECTTNKSGLESFVVCFSGFCLGWGSMAGEVGGWMSYVITKQRRHKILVLYVFQHCSNILFAVLLLPCKVAKSLFPETSLLVAIQLAHLNHLLVLLILHVVVHNLLETMGERLISCNNPSCPLRFYRDLSFSPSHAIPRVTQKPKTSLFFTLCNCLASTVRYFCRPIIYHAHLEMLKRSLPLMVQTFMAQKSLQWGQEGKDKTLKTRVTLTVCPAHRGRAHHPWNCASDIRPRPYQRLFWTFHSSGGWGLHCATSPWSTKKGQTSSRGSQAHPHTHYSALWPDNLELFHAGQFWYLLFKPFKQTGHDFLCPNSQHPHRSRQASKNTFLGKPSAQRLYCLESVLKWHTNKTSSAILKGTVSHIQGCFPISVLFVQHSICIASCCQCPAGKGIAGMQIWLTDTNSFPSKHNAGGSSNLLILFMCPVLQSKFQ